MLNEKDMISGLERLHDTCESLCYKKPDFIPFYFLNGS